METFANLLGVDPFSIWFFFEVLIGGLMAGVMYSLVALGFVLIFKASSVFNFAQGVMVLFAALNFVGFLEVFSDLPVVLQVALAFIVTMGVMILLALVVERVVLRPLVNQAHISLFMATIGIAIFLEGFGELIWGSNIKPLDIGIPDDVTFVGDAMIQDSDLFAAIVASILVVTLALFFHYTRIGRALRAVADDHQAALSIGIPLNHIWIIVWSVAGFVALVAGIMWGSKLGVQFSLSILALKALPVLILGGFTSIPGAIVGGLIIGAGEKLAEIFLVDAIQTYIYSGFPAAIEEWFAYILALGFLVFRPQGLFGEKIIERV
ncbi:MAG: branched-chain amino acid ABC transporter permease [Alphaproteobacteria bacterium]|jgi:branched-chain amino acid transport system permease protein|uniref:branched-chain amino acid ABC transporter permease n=1 Tax=Pacificispira sp. TaxID=2888761 RepID=UPI001B0F30DD|nr:branched-chain amino acid ABC transporter permease [Alphaproteobacteria bacterium]MBO6863928.1 branched-chain amino acid ABC transporter permease [Alphaproteobacteria bacterium]MEC9264697.1 branched-chain amino acid ABC transporter permease [Pseudomonadota bacterium]